MTSTLRRAGLPALALSAALLTGCGGKTDVAGTVTYQAKPVTSGAVTLVAADGQVYTGLINADGTYTVSGVPVGPVKVAVSSPNPNDVETKGRGAGSAERGKAGEKKAAGPPPGWFPIPDAAADPNKSGLSGTAEKGKPLDIAVR